jgi:hypothetical protein
MHEERYWVKRREREEKKGPKKYVEAFVNYVEVGK